MLLTLFALELKTKLKYYSSLSQSTAVSKSYSVYMFSSLIVQSLLFVKTDSIDIGDASRSKHWDLFLPWLNYIPNFLPQLLHLQ